MAKVVIYSTAYCPYCSAAKTLLRSKNIVFEEVDVTHDPARRAEMKRLSRRRTVPQIFIGDNPIGGYDNVRELEVSGELDRLLSKSSGT